MHDPETFEHRLTAALHRYTADDPRRTDAHALTRRIAGDTRTRRSPALGAWRSLMPSFRLGRARPLLLAVLIAAMTITLVATVVIVGAPRRPPSSEATFSSGAIAFTTGGVVYVADADGAHAVAFDAASPDEGTLLAIAFAPDRRHLAYLWTGAAGGRLVIATPDGETTGSFVLSDRVGMPWQLLFSWSPDGSRLATYTPDGPGQLVILGVDGQPLEGIALPEGAGGAEAYGNAMLPWSPDGKWIAVRGCPSPCDPSSPPDYLLVASDGSGSRPLVAPELSEQVVTTHQFMAWSPDGRVALNQWDPGRVEIVSSDGTGLQEVLLPEDLSPEEGEGVLAWSPSGDRLVALTRTADGSASQLVTIDEDLSVHEVPLDPKGLVGRVAWSADGEQLLYSSAAKAGDAYSLWTVSADGGVATRLVDGVDPVFDVASAP